MSLLDRFVIARISPAWALKRAQARVAYRAWAEYEAVAPSRLRRARKGRKSANAENERAAEDLRSLARSLEQNLDIASGALDVLIANVIGTGIQPEPQVGLRDGTPAEDFNRELMRLWEDWIHCPEVTQQHDYYSLQRLVGRSWLRDGDVFGQRLIGPVSFLDHGTVLPYSLEAIEADFVPYYDDPSRSIKQGIEINTWGRPRAIWMHKGHPGDTLSGPGDLKRMPADRVFHLKMVKRLHQLRGVSVFASAIARMDDIKEIDESERVAARVAAAMAGYIKKGTPDLWVPSDLDGDGQPEKRNMEFVPGMIFDDLMPGEDIGTINPNRPNNALIPFRDSQLRSAAAGLGAGYSSLSKNYNGTYSAQRQELVEQFVHYRMLTGTFIYRFCQPSWDGFIDAVRATGAVRLPPDVDMATIYNASHTAPPMPWIDPVKENQANEIAEERKWKSRPAIIRERGGNPDQVNREILRDERERERLGLDPGKPAAPTEQDDAPDDDAVSVNDVIETYGVAVRAGAVTPQIDDEEYFRQLRQFRPMSEEVRDTWKREGIRRPVTLKNGDPPPATPEE